MIDKLKFKIQNVLQTASGRTKLLIVALVVALVIGWLIWNKISLQKSESQPSFQASQDTVSQQDESPKIVSTKPDPLEEAIISATEVLELTFNKPLENEGEFKLRFDPKIEFEIKLSQDRKTAKIIPKKPYELGATYTMFIGPDTKFDGAGEWKQEKIFHFKTIRYRGI